MKICRFCLSSALSPDMYRDGVYYYHCAGCDRDDLTADDLWDADEFIAATMPDDEPQLGIWEGVIPEPDLPPDDEIDPHASIEAWEWWQAQEAHGNDIED